MTCFGRASSILVLGTIPFVVILCCFSLFIEKQRLERIHIKYGSFFYFFLWKIIGIFDTSLIPINQF